jgi:hypothetical protein
MVTKSKTKTATGSSRAKTSSTKEKATEDKRRAAGRSSSKASSKTSSNGFRKTAGEVGQIQQPKSPMPAQHQRKPGLESKLRPRPRYQAPYYKGAEKLKQKVALITGGDSGIGRAVAL